MIYETLDLPVLIGAIAISLLILAGIIFFIVCDIRRIYRIFQKRKELCQGKRKQHETDKTRSDLEF